MSKPAPRDFNKIDRALEMQVIDWLQWSDFSKPQEILGTPDYPALALELIAKRKSAYDRLAEENKILREAIDQAIHQAFEDDPSITEEYYNSHILVKALKRVEGLE